MPIIATHAESLTSFVQSYYKIARLLKPARVVSDLELIISNMIKLFLDEEINARGKHINLPIDAAQIPAEAVC